MWIPRIKKMISHLTWGIVFMSVACVGEEANIKSKYGEGLFAEMTTSKGKILLRLEMEKTPLTVTNFVGLAEGTLKTNQPAGKKFYDGLIFHRVIPNFMIQGGDPMGTGQGDPGYKFPDEFDATLKHDGPGVLSMANAGPGTNGSQFFITHKETPWLDGKHTVFGKVVEGQAVVDSIQMKDVLEKVTIIRIGKKAKAFKADQAAFDAMLKGLKDKELKKQEEALAMAKKEVTDYLVELEKKYPGKIQTSTTGLQWVVLKEGAGKSPAKGTNIKAHYTGTLLNGQEFDSSRRRGEPIAFKIGIGQVIPGWDEALLAMKKGEQRLLVIPSDLGYGAQGIGPIPPNSTLVFDVELVDF